MKLSTLLTEIQGSHGPVTGIELAARLGVTTGEVDAMLTALRASGKIGSARRTDPAPDNCASAGACSMSCPGPGECALVMDLNVAGLEIRRL